MKKENNHNKVEESFANLMYIVENERPKEPIDFDVIFEQTRRNGMENC